MRLALLVSLLFHALLLSLTYGGQGTGLPGLGFPWQNRRIEVPDLRIVLAPAQSPAARCRSSSFPPPGRSTVGPGN